MSRPRLLRSKELSTANRGLPQICQTGEFRTSTSAARGRLPGGAVDCFSTVLHPRRHYRQTQPSLGLAGTLNRPASAVALTLAPLRRENRD